MAVAAQTLDCMVSIDRLNIRNLVSADVLLRRIQLCLHAVLESPDSPSFEGARHFMGFGTTTHKKFLRELEMRSTERLWRPEKLHKIAFIVHAHRAAPGIEPGTSSTRTRNHTTRPSGRR